MTLQQTNLDKANNKMKQLSEDLNHDKEEAVNRKLGEITHLKKQLDQCKEALDQQEVQTQAHRQVLDSITMEKEALQVICHYINLITDQISSSAQ